MRRTLRNSGRIASGAALMLASSIQNAHSGAGTWISALAKTFLPSLSLMPLMWSGWKCEIAMVSIASGFTPAAASAPGMWPVVGPSWPPVPVSIRMSLEPVLTSSAVNEVGTMPGCRNESLSALLT